MIKANNRLKEKSIKKTALLASVLKINLLKDSFDFCVLRERAQPKQGFKYFEELVSKF